MTRRCSVCKEHKPTSEFHADKYKASGLMVRCKSCSRAYDARLRREGRLNRKPLTDRQKRMAADSVRRYQQANPEKKAAQLAVRKAIARGAIVRPIACQRCSGDSTRIEAHHADYARQLEVEFLCVKCHASTRWQVAVPGHVTGVSSHV